MAMPPNRALADAVAYETQKGRSVTIYVEGIGAITNATKVMRDGDTIRIHFEGDEWLLFRADALIGMKSEPL